MLLVHLHLSIAPAARLVTCQTSSCQDAWPDAADVDNVVALVRGLGKLRPGYEWTGSCWRKRSVPAHVLREVEIKKVRNRAEGASGAAAYRTLLHSHALCMLQGYQLPACS